jgi:hypothetical protein
MLPTVDTSAHARAARGELLTPHDMAEIFRMSAGQFSYWAKRGKFESFRVKAAVGRACYSGVLVQRHLNGEEVNAYVSTFGRKRHA